MKAIKTFKINNLILAAMGSIVAFSASADPKCAKATEEVIVSAQATDPKVKVELQKTELGQASAELAADAQKLLDESRFSFIKKYFSEKSPEKKSLILARLKQFIRLPWTIAKINRRLNEELNPQTLDANLRSFYGFFEEHHNENYRRRPWAPPRLSQLVVEDIEGIHVNDAVAVLRTIAEVEEPIYAYSVRSGETFKAFLPRLSRYMGQTAEQRDYAEAVSGIKDRSGPSWCAGGWCEEERRHAQVARIAIERITKKKPADLSPNVFDTDRDWKDADKVWNHFFSRQASEWVATTSWLNMAVHSKTDSAFDSLFANPLGDEIKHLTLFSTAYIYLYGKTNFFTRLRGMMKDFVYQVKSQAGDRTAGASLATNPAVVIQASVTMLLIEMKMRKYLKTLPAGLGERIFEEPYEHLVPKLAEMPTSDADKADLVRLKKEWEMARQSYRYWSDDERKELLQMRELERIYASEIEAMIDQHNLVHLYGKDLERATELLDFSSARDTKLLQKATYDRVRTMHILGDLYEKDTRTLAPAHLFDY